MTKRYFLTTFLALLTTITISAAPPRKGVGCWRGTPKRNIITAVRFDGQRRAAESSPFIGHKRGLVILANFTDMKFKSTNDHSKYNDILNTEDYTSSEGFRGSVYDYFRDQSGGLFELTFDVLGPFTTKKQYSYYGTNDSDGNDLRAHEMIIEMCQAADELVDFADYDWDGDGEVDEVFVVYAGKGEADGGTVNSIWPHMWTLEDAKNEKLYLDGVAINTYACANELKGTGRINGIGTFCHEFSHCMGFPDFYDTLNGKQYGMGDFDVMDQGCYNGNGFCPPGYTAYEKMLCGWQTPIVLADEDVDVDSLQPMSKGGQTYIIYNDANPDEFYTIENRQLNGWDKSYPARGLLVTHVDYDEYLWIYNYPNTIITDEKARSKWDYERGNDHPRMTFFHANNSESYPKLYPYTKNDSLTATSKPSASLYNANSLGEKRLEGAILDIRQNSDGTISFRYRAHPSTQTAVNPITLQTLPSTDDTYYTLDGRVAGTSKASLRPGIYVVRGKKVVITQ